MDFEVKKEKALKGRISIRCSTEIAHEFKEERDRFCEEWRIKDRHDNAFMKRLLDVYKLSKGL